MRLSCFYFLFLAIEIGIHYHIIILKLAEPAKREGARKKEENLSQSKNKWINQEKRVENEFDKLFPCYQGQNFQHIFDKCECSLVKVTTQVLIFKILFGKREKWKERAERGDLVDGFCC